MVSDRGGVFNGNHMIDDPLSLLSLGIWLMAAGMWPVGFLFGACSACCDKSEDDVCEVVCEGEGVCEGSNVCVLQESGEIAGYPGSSVLFTSGGSTFETLDFFGVNGYWLGHGFLTAATQSVLFSFGEARPRSVKVRIAGLDSFSGRGEVFNYCLIGANSVAFTVESGDKFIHSGPDSQKGFVKRESSGSSRIRIDAEGDICLVFVEVELINRGNNGAVVEVCFSCNPLP